MLTKNEKVQAVREWLFKTRLDSGVVNDTLGLSDNMITPQVLLSASSKLIKINKGEVEPDNRDNLKYSKFLGLEDLIKENIERDMGNLQRKAGIKIRQKKNLSWLHAGYFTPQVRSAIIGNPLSQNMEGINPMEHLDISHKVTKLGPGGIGSSEAIPSESRDVSSSSFGFFDPFHVPENENIGVTNFIAVNTVKGRDGKLHKLVKDKTGKKVWIDHETILSKRLGLPEH